MAVLQAIFVLWEGAYYEFNIYKQVYKFDFVA